MTTSNAKSVLRTRMGDSFSYAYGRLLFVRVRETPFRMRTGDFFPAERTASERTGIILVELISVQKLTKNAGWKG